MTTSLPPAQPIPPRGDLRRRVLAGERTIGAFVNLGSAASAELMARAGYDWLVLDLEHGMGTESELLAELLAVQGTPTTAVVRVQSVERLRIDRALDLGADGVMLPQVRDAAEARDGVRWMRYPPQGVRGLALITRGAGFGANGHPEVAATVNESILGVFQVESPEAVEAADELASIDGVDVLFVGPADLSHAMGIPGRIDTPEFVAALDRVITACRAHGKAAGILVGSGAAAATAFAQGFTFVGVGSDVSYVLAGARTQLEDARAGLR
ncbi:MAG TPA: aldolase/citrate lyase family protein [Candidatus Limnocylindrales bacterium]|nr:aldolase/citrate lyase family protein [Candidatus Limnocylindrales bacterium]